MTKQEFIKKWGKRITGDNYTATLHNSRMEIDLQKVIDNETENCIIPDVTNMSKLKDMIANQKDIDPEIAEDVNKNFWDLI
jgi:hypothetical protein